MDNFKKSMLWNALGNIIYLGCQWLLTLLVANIGSTSDAGLLSVAMSVSTIFQTVAMFGIRNFQISDVNEKYSDACYVTFRFITCTAALVGCVIFSLVSKYFDIQFVAIILFMLFRLSENFSDVLHGVAQKNNRLDIAGKSFAIKGIGSLVCFLAAFMLSGQKLWVGLLTMAVFSILTTVLFDALIVRKKFAVSFIQKDKQWLSLAKETAPLGIYLFLNSAISTVPKLILEKETNEDVLGIYSSIFAPALLISAAASYLYGPFVPVFAEHYNSKKTKAFLMTFLQITVAIVVFAILVIVAAIFFGKPALKLLFSGNPDIAKNSHLLVPILVTIFVSAIFTFICTLEIVFRDFLWLLISCGLGLASELALTKLLIISTGENGTSYGFIIGAAIPSAILLFRMLWILLGKGKRQKGV